MTKSKIISCVWFSADNGTVKGILDYYKAVFAEEMTHGTVVPLGETPSGNAELCEVKLFGQDFNFMCTATEHHSLNDAFSLIINCRDQSEIDRYWNYFTADGAASQCGWCSDKYGLRWQVVPEQLGELIKRPGGFGVLMQQQKIVIAAF